MKRLAFLLAVALLAAAAPPPRADGAMIIDIVQRGADVVATGSGTLNLAGLALSGGIAATPQVMPAQPVVIVGTIPGVLVDTYSGAITGPLSIGPGAQAAFASSGSGDTFGLAALGGTIFVPRGYTSGARLSGTATFAGQTIAGLGLSLGTYAYSFGSGASRDTITINVGAAVPEPASALLLGLGLSAAGIVGHRRLRRHAAI